MTTTSTLLTLDGEYSANVAEVNKGKAATARQAQLSRLLADLKKSQEAVGKQRRAAEDQLIPAASQVRQTLQDQLDGLLSKPLRDSIIQAIAEVDTPIKKLLARLILNKRVVENAEVDLKKAEAEVNLCEKAFENSQAKLKQLLPDITTSLGQVTKLKAAADQALSAGRLVEAFFQACDLMTAVKLLQEQAAEANEDSICDQVGTDWANLVRAWNDRQDKAEALEKCTSNFKTIEQNLKSLQQRREADIRAKLKELPSPGSTLPEPVSPVLDDGDVPQPAESMSSQGEEY